MFSLNGWSQSLLLLCADIISFQEDAQKQVVHTSGFCLPSAHTRRIGQITRYGKVQKFEKLLTGVRFLPDELMQLQ